MGCGYVGNPNIAALSTQVSAFQQGCSPTNAVSFPGPSVIDDSVCFASEGPLVLDTRNGS